MEAKSRIGDLKLGFTQPDKVPAHLRTILCLKGGENAPKAFNRFMTVDDPVRQCTYFSEDESFDAVSFFPLKDIRFLGFSVFHVATLTSDLKNNFQVIYRIRIGTECLSERMQEFSQSDVENKMVDIMLD